MSLAYVSAEFFIGAITSSPTLCIRYEDLVTLISKVDPEIVSYLNNECKGDIFYIFKKFPDVFVLSEHFVTLTDTFQCMNSFSHPSNHSATHKKFINPIEKAAVDYFEIVLSRVSCWHYLRLFNLMLCEGDPHLTHYFSNYTSSDINRFFYTHSDIFMMSDDNVSLRSKPSLNIKVSYLTIEGSSELINELWKSVCFLLSCFETLHFIELKQIISYVKSNLKDHLNKLSLIKQRELFENIPDTTMNETGFIRLVTFSASMSESRSTQLVLLIVCILAFEKEMHFLKLIKEVLDRTSSDINSPLRVLSVSDQFQFFKKYTEFFQIHGDGYVRLQSPFIFPVCVFPVYIPESLSLYFVNFQMHPNVLIPDDKLPVTNANEINDEKLQTKDCPQPSIINDEPKVLESVDNVFKDQESISSISKYSSVIDDRVKHSVLYLIKQFVSVNVKCALKTMLHVLDDVRKRFCDFSSEDKVNFLRECCQFLCSESKKRNSNILSISHISKKEKILLFITYTLIGEVSVHYEKLAKRIIESRIDDHLKKLSKSHQFKYFQAMHEYLTVPGSGYITLCSSFNSLNSLFGSYTGLFSEFQSKSNCSALKPKVNIGPEKNKEISNSVGNISCNGNESISKSSSSNSASPNPNNVLKLSGPEIEVPNDIYNRANNSIIFLQRYFDNLVSKHVLETVLYSLIDIQIYFCNLSSPHQLQFCEKCFQYVNAQTDNTNNETLYHYENISKNLTEIERNVLFTTYLLIEQKKMHYQNVVKAFKDYKVASSLCGRTDSEQFEYFKTLNRYFIILSDGHLCVQPRFVYLSSITDLLAAHIPKIKSKIRVEVKSNNSIIDNTDSKVINIITDLCFAVLSSCQKIHIEKLCHRVTSCSIRNVKHFFSLFTHSEKLNFLKNISENFEISKEGFVSLRKGAIDSYFPQSNINTSELLLNNYSLSKSVTDIKMSSNKHESAPSSRRDSVRSSDISEFSETHSLGYMSDIVNQISKKKRKRKSKKSLSKLQQQQSYPNRNKSNSVNSIKVTVNVPQSTKVVSVSRVIKKSSEKLNGTLVPVLSTSQETKHDCSFGSPDSHCRTESQNFDKKSLKLEKMPRPDVTQSAFEIKMNKSDNIALSRTVKSEKISKTNIDSNSEIFCVEDTKLACDIKVPEIQGTSRNCEKKKESLHNSVISTYINSDSEKCKINLHNNKESEHLSNRSLSSFQETTEINNSTKETQLSTILSSISEKAGTLSTNGCEIRNLNSISSDSVMKSNLVSDKIKDIKYKIPRQPSQCPRKTSRTRESCLVMSVGASNSSSGNTELLHTKSFMDNLNCDMNKYITAREKFLDLDCAKSSGLKEIVHPTFSTSSFDDQFCFEELQNDGFFQSYGLELVDSLLGESKASNCKMEASNAQTNVFQDSETFCGLHNSGIYESIFNDPGAANSHVCGIQPPVPKPVNKQGLSLNCSKQETSEDIVNELRAVNFFCVILRKYDVGLSAAFLRKHLNMASLEVQSFILENFESNILPLFCKHKKIFYVSPYSENIYLTKRLSCLNEGKV